LKAGGLIQKVKPSNANWGQPRLLCAASCLALYLAWTQSQRKQSILGLIFGVTAHHVSLWTRFACRLLIKGLMTDERAVVQMSSGQEVAAFKDSIFVKYPSLQHVCGAMDGLKLQLQKAGNEREQSMFYNNWTHRVACFCFFQMVKLMLAT